MRQDNKDPVKGPSRQFGSDTDPVILGAYFFDFPGCSDNRSQRGNWQLSQLDAYIQKDTIILFEEFSSRVMNQLASLRRIFIVSRILHLETDA